MFSRAVPIGFGWRWKDVKSSPRFLIPLIFLAWFFDKVGWALEYTPFCFLFAGFWENRYIPQGRKIIQKYRQGSLTREECEKLLRGIDHKLYLPWLLVLSPMAFALIFILIPLILNISVFLLIPLVFLFHEFACPSSIRRWRKAEEMGDKELAEIINKAGPSCLRYFRKFVLEDKN